jgi:O-antigen/teichoic acid export membrane protein
MLKLKHVAKITFGIVSSQTIQVITLPIIARLYQPNQIAEQAVLIQIVSMTAAIASFRYEVLVPIPKQKRRKIDLLTTAVVISAIVVFGIAVSFLAYFSFLKQTQYNANSILTIELAFAITIITFILPLAAGLQNFAVSNKSFSLIGKAEILGKTTQQILAIFLGLGKTGFVGLAAAMFLGSLAKAYYLFYHERIGFNKLLKFRPIRLIATAKQFFGVAAATLLSHSITTLTSLLLPIWFGALYGKSYLGQLAMTLTILWMPSQVLSNSAGSIFYSQACNYISNQKSYQRLFNQLLAILALIGILQLAILAGTSPWIFKVILGPNWSGVGIYATILALPAALSTISSPFDKTPILLKTKAYPILWSAFRILSTAIVFQAAAKFNLTDVQCVQLLAVQMTVTYTSDLINSFHSSRSYTVEK